jgi:alkyl hydroperoxide reductase subunit F
MIYDVVIIGAGPAGMSAGIYCCRQKLSTLILAKELGGQAAKSWQIQNYLGYNLISGAELVLRFKEHLESFNSAELKTGVTVNAIKKLSDHFLVNVDSGEVFEGKSIIITSGKQPQRLNIAGETEFIGHGVSYCATCDAPLFKDKAVAVIGSGDSALEAVYQLTKIASQIYFLIREPEFRQSLDQVLLAKIKKSLKVEFLYNTQATKISGNKLVSGLEYKNSKTQETKTIEVQGIFLEIGSVPVVSFAQGLFEIDGRQEIIVDEHNMTTQTGIFAAGDVSNVVGKQIIIAAGEGAKAALGVASYLSRKSEVVQYG